MKSLGIHVVNSPLPGVLRLRHELEEAAGDRSQVECSWKSRRCEEEGSKLEALDVS